MRYSLRTLLILLACLVPVNFASLFFVAMAVESPMLNLTFAREVFYGTAIAFLIVLVAIPGVLIFGNSHG